MKIKILTLSKLIFGQKFISSLYKQYVFKNYLKTNLIFVHIPKTGGTSVTDVLYGKRVGHYTALEIQQWLGVNKFNSMRSFAVVRNPYDRLLSGYRFVRYSGGSKGGVHKNIEFQRSEFSNFESFVRNWLAYQDHNTIDILFRPQYLFLMDSKGKCMVERVFKIENVNEIQAYLNDLTGINNIFPYLNNSLNKEIPIEISEELKLIIYKFYYKDFQFFNY